MESLPYFLICFAGAVVAGLLLFSASLFTLGLLMFTLRIFRRDAATRKSVTVPLVTMMTGAILFACLGIGTIETINWMRHNAWRASQPALCLDIPLTENYKFSVFQQADRAWGYLETIDGSRTLVGSIKQYTVLDDLVLGKDPWSWFWIDLNTGEFELGLTHTKYRAVLKGLGYSEEPTLESVEGLCDIYDCGPCLGGS